MRKEPQLIVLDGHYSYEKNVLLMKEVKFLSMDVRICVRVVICRDKKKLRNGMKIKMR